LSIDNHTIITKPNTFIDVWPNIQFIIIDEVSIIGCTLFATIYLQLQKLKYNFVPFRGINIIFMKDFLQFSPITYTPLYSTNIQPNFMFTTNKLIRKSLWKIYIKLNNSILMKNETKKNQYEIIFKKPSKKTYFKFKLQAIKTPFLSNININLFNDPWIIATYIVLFNEL